MSQIKLNAFILTIFALNLTACAIPQERPGMPVGPQYFTDSHAYKFQMENGYDPTDQKKWEKKRVDQPEVRAIVIIAE